MNKLWIIDVRTPAEYAIGHAQNAVNIPVDQVASINDFLSVEPDDTVLVYCASGARSEMAKNTLINKLGFNNVINVIDQQGLGITLSKLQ